MNFDPKKPKSGKFVLYCVMSYVLINEFNNGDFVG